MTIVNFSLNTYSRSTVNFSVNLYLSKGKVWKVWWWPTTGLPHFDIINNGNNLTGVLQYAHDVEVSQGDTTGMVHYIKLLFQEKWATLILIFRQE